MDTEKLTEETITDDEIRRLRTEAGSAGDYHQVTICDSALDMPRPLASDATEGHLLLNHESRKRARFARRLCADVINAARAMDDSQAVRS